MSSSQLTTPKFAAYAQEERPNRSDAANLDKRRREPGTGLTPDKKEARGDRGTGSDASAALAALESKDLNCNRSPLGSDSEVIVDSEMPKR